MAQTFSSIARAQRFHVVARHEAHAFQHGIEILAVLGLAGEGERAHGASVERVVQRDHDALLRPAGGVTGSAHQLQRAFDGLGAAVGEERAVQSGLGAELLGQQSLVLVVVQVGNVDDLRRLLADDLHDARMGVAQRVDAQPGEEVEVALALDVINVHAFAAGDGDGIAGIGVQQIFLFAFDNFLIGGRR